MLESILIQLVWFIFSICKVRLGIHSKMRNRLNLHKCLISIYIMAIWIGHIPELILNRNITSHDREWCAGSLAKLSMWQQVGVQRGAGFVTKIDIITTTNGTLLWELSDRKHINCKMLMKWNQKSARVWKRERERGSWTPRILKR